ncbi:odorant-binding protein-like [Microtus oregoni]|uniref:odorant-binding protein-like n=1 Tax=Microtus oregoni TaxID=111838 RepID=UPI001BB0E029|nr:odorant-binding protein-like [Microtus oregoni]
MVKFLLLALAFGLAHAQAELEGKWVTTAIAADNVDKIEAGGPLRLYVREITCTEACSKMEVTFYVNVNNQCSQTQITGYRQEDGNYRTQFEGDNVFKPVSTTEDNIVFTGANVDRAGQTTNLIFVVGKGQPLTPEKHEKLEAYAKERSIPPENFRDVLATGLMVKRMLGSYPLMLITAESGFTSTNQGQVQPFPALILITVESFFTPTNQDQVQPFPCIIDKISKEIQVYFCDG